MADTPAITYEEVVVNGDRITTDLLVWRRYRWPAPGVDEILQDINPHLADLMAKSLFLPVGTLILMPIVIEIMQRRATGAVSENVWGRAVSPSFVARGVL